MEEKQDLQEDMQEGIQDMKEYIKLLWVTNDAEKQIMRMARVSSDNRDSDDTRLLSYLIRNKHFSPFEMANLAIEIKTSRA